ncbi:MAG: DUF262 domain-containing protein [Candidatus Moranbacteria bacterium]|jgi:hypothetical protein|nr:DUF262 domain-containing protein [Candidatus Moranbacteria bacterium]
MNVSIEEIKDEKNDEFSSDDLYNIKSWGADLSIRELIDRYNDRDMIKPELQRKYVWDKNEASYFIDSLLLGLPVPSIFLAQDSNQRWLIVDGYQRLMTVNDYIHVGVFSRDKKRFSLSNSQKINEQWRNKTFQELEDSEKRRLRNTTIHAIIFEQKEPRDNDSSLFQIFERINASGKNLMPQEIRNCIFQGIFNRLLFELNVNSDWRVLFGTENEDSRMRDIELILRFFALKSENIKNIKIAQISLKKYLNDFMGENKNLDKDTENIMRTNFNETMKLIYESFGKTAFRNFIDNSKELTSKRFHPTIFDSIAIATSNAIEVMGDNLDLKNIKLKRENLLRNEKYQQYISVRTTNIESILGRINLASKTLFDIDYV